MRQKGNSLLPFYFLRFLPSDNQQSRGKGFALDLLVTAESFDVNASLLQVEIY